jgi:hypothetical protein
LGRWGSEDPSGVVDGPNLFTYVRSRPVTFVDPAGLQSVKTSDPKVVRTPTLPGSCPPNACGCTDATVDIQIHCECKENGWIMTATATYGATIYVRTTAWTPEWLIRRHERGHVTDDLEVLQWAVKQRKGPYSTKRVCEAAGDELKQRVQDERKARSRSHDFLVRRLCW